MLTPVATAGRGGGVPEDFPVARRATATVCTVAARELRGHSRAGYFVTSTVLVLALLLGYLLLHASVFTRLGGTTVGLVGQATAMAEPLREAANDVGEDLDVVPYRDADRARADVARGELDVLVSGSLTDLRTLSGSELDESLRALLIGIARDEVLNAKLVESGLDPTDVHGDVATARVTAETVEPPVATRTERTCLALATVLLLGFGIAGSSLVAARSLVEDGGRSRWVALGKVVGVGLAGGTQLLLLGAAAVAVTTATGALSTFGAAASTLAWGPVWFALGYALYSPLFVAAGSGGGPLRSVIPSVAAVVVAGLGTSMLVLPHPTGMIGLVASFVPPLSPFAVASRVATGAAEPFEVVAAVLLTVASAVVLTRVLHARHRAFANPTAAVTGGPPGSG